MSYTVLFNTTATHGLPAALNAASNALLRTIHGPESGGIIRVANHPMPTLHNEAAAKFSKVAGAQSVLPQGNGCMKCILSPCACSRDV